jgi:hypothetical protein
LRLSLWVSIGGGLDSAIANAYRGCLMANQDYIFYFFTLDGPIEQ